MKIKYLGTGAAEGVPAMFCSCDNCKKIRELGKSQFRTRSQTIIDGKICIDFPPEAYAHSLEYGVDLSSLGSLLVTHSHMDHFYAHDFILRGYKYARVTAPVLKIYGNEEVEKVFCECTARELKPEVAPNLSFTVIRPYDEFEVEDYRVIALPARHSKTEAALLYYIEKNGKGYLHFYDSGVVGDEVFDFLKSRNAKISLVSFDCTFAESSGGEGARHMGLPDNMLMKQKMLCRGLVGEDTTFVITHFSHNCNPIKSRLAGLEKEFGVIAAYDGFEVEI